MSHQWENAQNYVCYEALYGGYPLVRNSHLIENCGYRYHEFDCEKGAILMNQTFAGHDQNLAVYRADANIFL
ncbi:DUF2827 family protein [Paraburkholderia sp. J12]|uniref:DUF2827 family protein n=1 Tax=Paraburkholderia sp. J12 TaxID=2805432 RepID=UPI002ABDBDFC|nr:DUF2827 family protein [Paraburkholderia sp. J12]